MSKTSRNFPRNNGHNNSHNNGGHHSNGGNKYRNDRKPGTRSANPYQSLQKAKQSREKYLTFAREALSSGDHVEAESHFQYADHYTRLINELLREKYVMERENPSVIADAGEASQEGNEYPPEEKYIAADTAKPQYQRHNRNPQEVFSGEDA